LIDTPDRALLHLGGVVQDHGKWRPWALQPADRYGLLCCSTTSLHALLWASADVLPLEKHRAIALTVPRAVYLCEADRLHVGAHSFTQGVFEQVCGRLSTCSQSPNVEI